MIKDLSFRFPKVNIGHIKALGSIVLAMKDTRADQGLAIPEFPSFLDRFLSILNSTGSNPGDCLELLYPFPYFYNADQQSQGFESVFAKFGVNVDFRKSTLPFTYKSIISHTTTHKKVIFTNNLTLTIPAGPSPSSQTPFFIETSYHTKLLTLMLLSHSHSDFVLVGPKGVGKSILLKRFANLLGYKIEFIPLYKDLSSRDLLVRRDTDNNGNSVWINSGLINAALNGHLAVLDGLDVLSNDTITSLQRLIVDRQVDLPNGRKLISAKAYGDMMKRYEWSVDEMIRRGVYKIHEGFRIVGLGNLTGWLKPEVVGMFSFVVLRPMNVDEEALLMENLFPGLESSLVKRLTVLTSSLRAEKDEGLAGLAMNFSTRQLLRIGRRLSVFPNEDLHTTISKISLSAFLPLLARDALKLYLKKYGINHPVVAKSGEDLVARVYRKEGREYFQIGNIEAPVQSNTDPALIPKVLFYQNQKQISILQDLIKDYILGENILLIGNQGVGKNKIVDYFLEMMKLPRE
jgi:von Willebrand factor A domain-containing protein 8